MFPTKSTYATMRGSRRVLQQHRITDTSREAMLKHTRKSTPGRPQSRYKRRATIGVVVLFGPQGRRRVHYNSCPSMATLKSPAELPAKLIEGWSPTTSGRRTTGRAIPGNITGLRSWIFAFFILALYLALSGFLSGTLLASPTYCFGDAHLNAQRLHGL